MTPSVEDRLIVALDVPALDDARRLVAGLGDTVRFYKLGMWLLFLPGADGFAAELLASGKQLFLDYKLHDIGETVRAGAAAIAQGGARFLTVHGEPQVMRAAVQGCGGTGLGVLAISVLTSLDDSAVAALGYAEPVAALVARRVRDAAASGCEGIVASAADDPYALKALAGRPMLVVTPGIRLPGDALGDQSRTASPAQAVRSGADYLVVGRPIVRAAVPADAARRVLDDMGRAWPA